MNTKPQSETSKSGQRDEAPGVFRHLVNHAAFVDKVVVNVWGVRRKRSPSRIVGKDNLAIGGPGRFYARCLPRHHRVSGNNLQLKYGVMRPYGNLSPFVLTLWSGGSALTCADVLLVLDGLMRCGYKAVVSSLELTFDTAGIPLRRFANDLCSRARVRKFPDRNGKTTIYVGATRAPWELRLYEKTDSIVRAEFVLRSTFLRALAIREPQDLLLVKKALLWRKVGFREVSVSEINALPWRVRKRWLERGLAIMRQMPASVVARELRQAGVDPGDWIVRSNRERLLRRMQKALVW